MKSKKLLTKMLCAVLAITMLFGTAMISAQAKTTEKTYEFENIEDLRKTFTDIFVEEYDQIYDIAVQLRASVANDGYEYFTYTTNCGPTSAAFRKVLYDYGYVVETQQKQLNHNHIFDFMRVTFADSPDKLSYVVIDPTYKQYVTEIYKQSGLNNEDIAKDLPPVLIYEYGNKAELEQQLQGAKASLQENFQAMCDNVYNNEYGHEFLPNDYQRFEYLGAPSLYQSTQFMDELRNNSGHLDFQAETTPYILSTSTNKMKEFVYDGNGVYRCYIPSDELDQYCGGFVITDKDGNIMYGMEESDISLKLTETLPVTNSAPFSITNTLLLMNRKSTQPLKINTMNYSMTGLMLNLDFGAGVETPVVYCYVDAMVQKYGDVNNDGTIDVTDVSLLEKCIIGTETLDGFAMERADVLKCGALNIKNVTEIQKHITDGQSFKCGSTLYFSQLSSLRTSAPIGYVDI